MALQIPDNDRHEKADIPEAPCIINIHIFLRFLAKTAARRDLAVDLERPDRSLLSGIRICDLFTGDLLSLIERSKPFILLYISVHHLFEFFMVPSAPDPIGNDIQDLLNQVSIFSRFADQIFHRRVIGLNSLKISLCSVRLFLHVPDRTVPFSVFA